MNKKRLNGRCVVYVPLLISLFLQPFALNAAQSVRRSQIRFIYFVQRRSVDHSLGWKSLKRVYILYIFVCSPLLLLVFSAIVFHFGSRKFTTDDFCVEGNATTTRYTNKTSSKKIWMEKKRTHLLIITKRPADVRRRRRRKEMAKTYMNNNKNMILIYKIIIHFFIVLYSKYEGYSTHSQPEHRYGKRCAVCASNTQSSIDSIIVVSTVHASKGVTSVWTHSDHCGSCLAAAVVNPNAVIRVTVIAHWPRILRQNRKQSTENYFFLFINIRLPFNQFHLHISEKN